MQENIVPFAKTNFRNQSKVFGIKTMDRRNHMYVIGKTGTGKTTLLRNMMISDILAGNGVAVVDPHGEFAESILDYVPETRIKDVVYFNPADLDYPIAFNAVEKVGAKERHLVSSGLISIFKKIWADSWGPRLEYVLRNAILALLEQPDSTLLGVMRILSDKEYRKRAVENLTDPVVKQFWIEEFGKYSSKFEVEAVAPIQNKVGQFLTNPMIRNIVGQQKSSIHMRQIMDEKKILIMNLSKGRVGEDSSMLMGAMMITKIQQAAMSRIDMDEEQRSDFYLYVDEFQNFATESFAGILSEARKYRLDLTLAHQYVAQLDETVRDAVVGNAGTLITFRIGADDAEFFEKEFSPEIMALDLVNLPNQKIYLKLMIDGVTSRAFSANTLPPITKPEKSFKDEIIDHSRKTYGTPRSVVEEQIRAWSAPVGMVFSGLESIGAVAPPPGEKSERKTAEKGDLTFHDATCDNCGKAIQVPFLPDPKRKTYCKTCLPAMKAKAAKKKETETVQPEETHLEMAIPAPSALSLNDALQRAPQKFTARKSEANGEKKQRKGPDVEGLRDILAHSLEGMHPTPTKPAHATEEKNTITLEDISKF